jgi:hypothetical protein
MSAESLPLVVRSHSASHYRCGCACAARSRSPSRADVLPGAAVGQPVYLDAGYRV